jgi:16S rRNA (guanine966-N2)-methyltransferase
MPSKPDSGSVRIIAGQWRSRRLPVADVQGLRPSGDRARETLFNWLQAYIPGARCADLFAGSGALGFEAASRGAASVALVESNARVLDHLEKSIELLNATQVSLYHGDVLGWLGAQAPQSFDMIFIDPPFQDQLHDALLESIDRSGCLAPGGFVYLESPASRPQPVAPSGWSCWRGKVMGDVRLQVFRSKGGTVE